MAEERQWRDERGATGDIDEREIRWAARMQRATMGPGAMVAETRKFMETDIRAVLPTIHAATLVVARTGHTMSDPRSARCVADRIEAGMVYVNIVLADSPELPFGGVKRSGTAREMGLLAADEFVNKKLIRTAG